MPRIVNHNVTKTIFNIHNNGALTTQQVGGNNSVSYMNSVKDDVESLREDLLENVEKTKTLQDGVELCSDDIWQMKLELKSYKATAHQLSVELEESREESRNLKRLLTENGKSIKLLRDDLQKLTKKEGETTEKTIEHGVILKICESIYGVRGYIGEIRADRKMKVQKVKEEIEIKFGCNFIGLCRTENEKKLPDDKTLQELKIKEGTVLFIVK